MIHFRHDRARQTLPAARIAQQPPRLLGIVEQALAESGTAPSRFGRDAVNDPALVLDLRAGRQPRAPARAAILAHVERIGAGSAVQHA